jgi:hypothetical protein
MAKMSGMQGEWRAKYLALFGHLREVVNKDSHEGFHHEEREEEDDEHGEQCHGRPVEWDRLHVHAH